MTVLSRHQVLTMALGPSGQTLEDSVLQFPVRMTADKSSFRDFVAGSAKSLSAWLLQEMRNMGFYFAL